MGDDGDVLEQLDHILEFQLGDLVEVSSQQLANFLVAVGCMNTIEFLGGVRNGELGENHKVDSRFKEGVRLLGGEYTTFGEDNMYRLRNGLTHQYLPSLDDLALIRILNDRNNNQAIFRDNGVLALNVARLVDDIKTAWNRLRCELLQNAEMRSRAQGVLARLPRLL